MIRTPAAPAVTTFPRPGWSVPRWSSTAGWPAQRVRAAAFVVAALAAILGFHLFALLRWPTPFVDEAWNANRAWAMLHTGQPFGTMDAGVFEHYDGYWTFMPWLGTALHIPAIWLLGPTLLAVRLTSLVFGGLLLWALYSIASRFYGRSVGLLAVFLTALSPSFLYSAHMGRHDVIVAAFGFGAVALVFAEHTRGDAARIPARSLLAGLLVGLTLDIHLNGVIYGPTIAALYLAECNWSLHRLVRCGRFWSFAAGAGAGLTFFTAMHVLRYPQTYLALASFGPAADRIPPLFTLDPHVWLQSAGDFALFVALVGPWSAGLTLAAVMLLGRRGSAADRRLLTLLAALCVSSVALMRVHNGFYGILITPATDLCAAAILADVFGKAAQGLRRRAPLQRLPAGVVAALAIAFVLAGLKWSLAPALSSGNDDALAALDRVTQVVPPGNVVLGSQTYWFALPPEQRYLSWEQLYYYQRQTPGSTLIDAFRALRPNYFILDGHVMRFVVGGPGQPEPPRGFTLQLSGSELFSFLSERGHVVADVTTASLGEVRVYQIDWN